MPENVLETTIKKVFEFQTDVFFTWHGGEPLLPGLDFYKNVMRLINKYKTDKHHIRNYIQTNATLITDDFAQFMKENDFVVSVSIDGDKYVHDFNRIDHSGTGSFDSVMNGVKILRAHGLQPPVIATVTKETKKYARETFEFLATNGFTDIKYSPVYDSVSDNFSISSDDWFYYLKDVLSAWFEKGDTNIVVRELDEVISWLSNKKVNLCTTNQACLNWISLDPDGSIYPCEYLRSEMPYGNIMNTNLYDLQKTVSYQRFKRLFLHKNEKCAKCDFFELCGNGCPANRVRDNKMSPDGIYVYCEQKKKLFLEIKSIFESENQ